MFLRKQLAMYEARKVKPKRATNAIRIAMTWLSRLFDWKNALIVVKPATLIRWHRYLFKLFWKLKSQGGRPTISEELQLIIRQMHRDNPTWGEERIANELELKLSIKVSPRTVGKYLPSDDDNGKPGKLRTKSQRWKTFIHNHLKETIACDFFTVFTWNFKILYVFVVMELESRKILHQNVTAHPTAQWTIQQFREAIPSDHNYRFIIHDRDSIFSAQVDKSLKKMGVRALKTPVRSPTANAFCERLIGSARRECMDNIIPLSERHVYRTMKEWSGHYNSGRPHMALGPGIPEPPDSLPVALLEHRHKLPSDAVFAVKSVLGGLHHEYELKKAA